MSRRILIVRPSSLGDIVHALPVVHDVHTYCGSDVQVDWIAEEAFASLIEMNHGVHRVIPFALRRWRRELLHRATWRQMAQFRTALRARAYHTVIDLQEQLKGALVSALARGHVHGPDRASIREPLATLAYRGKHAIDPQQHLIDRCRQLAGKALGYASDGPPVFDLVPPPLTAAQARPYVVLVHATSRPDKLWPEANWRKLVAYFAAAGDCVVLPWGSADEEARSRRLAEGFAAAIVPPRTSLPQVASLLSQARVVCGVDTGLVHLAAALGVPTLALFTVTDPTLAGVARASRCAADLGGNGEIPSPEHAIATMQRLSAASLVG